MKLLALALLCAGAWAQRARTELGDSGWTLILPKDYDKSAWAAGPKTAGSGYVVPGQPMGGRMALSWTRRAGSAA